MKLVSSGPASHVFLLAERERVLLMQLLSLYPRVPADHHKASKSATPASPETEQVLKEALLEQRQQNQKIVAAFLNDPVRFRKSQHGWDLNVTDAEVEWLLEILNDVRVGSWLALGAPEDLESIRVDEEPPIDLLFMELAGFFQMQILHAIED
jgi:hypothetical protein